MGTNVIGNLDDQVWKLLGIDVENTKDKNIDKNNENKNKNIENGNKEEKDKSRKTKEGANKRNFEEERLRRD